MHVVRTVLLGIPPLWTAAALGGEHPFPVVSDGKWGYGDRAGKLVIWDMGAIAASGRPGALELFRKVMLASAALPIAFPPVYFEVEADGRRYEETHVDGGLVTQVFFYGCTLDLPAAARETGLSRGGPARLYSNATSASGRIPLRLKMKPVSVGAQ